MGTAMKHTWFVVLVASVVGCGRPVSQDNDRQRPPPSRAGGASGVSQQSEQDPDLHAARNVARGSSETRREPPSTPGAIKDAVRDVQVRVLSRSEAVREYESRKDAINELLTIEPRTQLVQVRFLANRKTAPPGKSLFRARLGDGTPVLATASRDAADKAGAPAGGETRIMEMLYQIPSDNNAFDLILNDLAVFHVDLQSLPRPESPRSTGVHPEPPARVAEKAKHFKSPEIAFDYPEEWASWPKDSFDRMQTAAKSMGGIDLLALLKAPDERRLCQIVRNRNPASFESLFREKKKVADQVTSGGIEVMGQRYVKYSASVVTIAGGRKAVLASAEKSNGETGISYMFLSGGYEYNVNFIYLNATDAIKGERLRMQVLDTLTIQD